MPGGAGDVLPRVGALVEGPAFHPYLSGRDNLLRLDAADRTADAAHRRARGSTPALDRVGLLAAADKRYRAYSLGMRQRLAIAAALLRPRDLLVLDEPTNGLDPQGTREVRHLVAELAEDGTTVLVSSHLLAEVEQMCSHVGVMHAAGWSPRAPLAELRGRPGPRGPRRHRPPAEAAAGAARARAADVHVDRDRGQRAGCSARSRRRRSCRAGARRGRRSRGFAVDSPSLEDVFVSLTGEGFDVSG